MRLYKLAAMKDGWICGDFFPSAFRTSACEVAYRRHPKGQEWPKHMQKQATEINLLVSGLMQVEVSTEFGDTVAKTIQPGDIFVIDPNEMAKPTFYEDCILVVVKTPSIPGDKIIELCR